MMNLDNLNYLKKTIDSGETLSQKMQSLVLDLVEEKIYHISDSEDSFIYFYEDVIQNKLTVIFKDILSEGDYSNASEHSKVCLALCGAFRELPKNAKVGAWISDALKLVDYLVLHYIQEIQGDVINPDDYTGDKSNLGEERRRYDKMKSYGKPVSDAGAWLDQLYLIRNRIQHNTIVNIETGKHALILLKYSQIEKSISKKYPMVLKLIEHIYKE